MNPSVLCESLRGSLPTLFQCSIAPGGAVQVRTPFMYPDGDIVDVFVEERGTEYLLTDYGEALGWLQMQSFSDELTPSQRRLVEDVCLTLGIEVDRGQLTLRCAEASALGEAVQRLGQAGVRVSDIWFTLQTRTVGTIADDVDEWLRGRSFDFERSIRRNGRSGRVWTVDYQIVADSKTSLVFLLSTGTQSWARRLSERVVAECTDLSHLTVSHPSTSFVSLFDDTTNVWREEDFALVEGVSRIAIWSRRDEFERILTTEWARDTAPLAPLRRSSPTAGALLLDDSPE